MNAYEKKTRLIGHFWRKKEVLTELIKLKMMMVFGAGGGSGDVYETCIAD